MVDENKQQLVRSRLTVSKYPGHKQKKYSAAGVSCPAGSNERFFPNILMMKFVL
jgi:hypothetical protein